MKNNFNVIEELYRDFTDKRNNLKIELDNYLSELEVVEKSMDYDHKSEDEYKLFSPRNNDGFNGSYDELSIKRIELEKLIEKTRADHSYYDDYCEKLKALIISDNGTDINDLIYRQGSEGSGPDITDEPGENNEDDHSSSEPGFDMDDLKDRLSSVCNKLNTCLKIFDNDIVRSKQELKHIESSIKSLLDSLE
ncbi:MAG: hypothetical protein K6F34_10525 [Lachnospiraceae bacterium]|nr:hypothetical protein [Lachnospiraceae bacterium]